MYKINGAAIKCKLIMRNNKKINLANFVQTHTHTRTYTHIHLIIMETQQLQHVTPLD